MLFFLLSMGHRESLFHSSQEVACGLRSLGDLLSRRAVQVPLSSVQIRELGIGLAVQQCAERHASFPPDLGNLDSRRRVLWNCHWTEWASSWSVLLWIALPLSHPALAIAEPLNLFDSHSRPISVSVEISPREAPARLDSIYTPAFPAWMEAGDRADEVRVIIPGLTVERLLLGDEEPVVGSFSDFVWTLDVQTGHVISATLSGKVLRSIRLGFANARVAADIEIDMGTGRVGGIKEPKTLLGQIFFAYCRNPSSRDCQIVETRSYDGATGYVNAIGRLQVRSSLMTLNGFSPLGEAIFSELDESTEPLAFESEFLAPASGS